MKILDGASVTILGFLEQPITSYKRSYQVIGRHLDYVGLGSCNAIDLTVPNSGAWLLVREASCFLLPEQQKQARKSPTFDPRNEIGD